MSRPILIVVVLAQGAALALGCAVSPAGVSVESVAPSRVDATLGATLELRGSFPIAITFDLDAPRRSSWSVAYAVRLDGAATRTLVTTWRDEETLEALLEGGVPAGRYGVVVVDPRGRTASLQGALEVAWLDGGSWPQVDGGGDRDGGPGLDAGPEPDGGPGLDGGWDGGTADASADAGDGGVCYADEDSDGYGARVSQVTGCVRRGGDCNERDPLTHPAAEEVCNRLDDDCDGLIDEAGCPPDAGWHLRQDTGGSSEDYFTAWSYARGALWVAGRQDVRHRAGPDQLFQSVASCPPWAHGSWVSPDGRLALGSGIGGAGTLASALPAGASCFGSVSTDDEVVGIAGFAALAGGATVVAATRHGQLWHLGLDGGFEAVSKGTSPTLVFEDLHGASLEALLAAGSQSETQPRAAWWRDGGWVEVVFPGAGLARGVWVLSGSSAFVVGDDGLAMELRGGSWVRLEGLDAGVSLRAVRAFSPGRVYAVELAGRVWRWDGWRWEVLLELAGGVELNDLTGTSEDDLWVVGLNGVVAHWP